MANKSMYTEHVVEVPHEEIPEEMLKRLIEEFVTREGTDYGEVEFSLEEKVARVIELLDRGHAKIMFEARTNSLNIVDNSP